MSNSDYEAKQKALYALPEMPHVESHGVRTVAYSALKPDWRESSSELWV